MRRLVAISGKSTKAIMVLVALSISLTSIHMVAAARTASLQREQEQIELRARTQEHLAPTQTGFISHPSERNDITEVAQSASGAQRPSGASDSSQVVASLAVAAPKRRIVISIADRKLAMVEDGRLVKTYSIAVGTRSTPSPDGEFVIINRAKDPTYRHANKEIPPGKDNPLGSRWMGLNV